MFGEADAQTDPSLQLAESSTLPQPASIEVTRSALAALFASAPAAASPAAASAQASSSASAAPTGTGSRTRSVASEHDRLAAEQARAEAEAEALEEAAEQEQAAAEAAMAKAARLAAKAAEACRLATKAGHAAAATVAAAKASRAAAARARVDAEQAAAHAADGSLPGAMDVDSPAAGASGNAAGSASGNEDAGDGAQGTAYSWLPPLTYGALINATSWLGVQCGAALPQAAIDRIFHRAVASMKPGAGDRAHLDAKARDASKQEQRQILSPLVSRGCGRAATVPAGEAMAPGQAAAQDEAAAQGADAAQTAAVPPPPSMPYGGFTRAQLAREGIAVSKREFRAIRLHACEYGAGASAEADAPRPQRINSAQLKDAVQFLSAKGDLTQLGALDGVAEFSGRVQFSRLRALVAEVAQLCPMACGAMRQPLLARIDRVEVFIKRDLSAHQQRCAECAELSALVQDVEVLLRAAEAALSAELPPAPCERRRARAAPLRRTARAAARGATPAG